MIKSIKNKKGEKFGFGLLVVFLSISISLFAFVSEQNNITGFAAFENNKEQAKIIQNDLAEFNDVNSLITLAAGNYYIDDEGIVYWIDDSSRPAIARVRNVDETQKNRNIYIDDNGRVGYVLDAVTINSNQ